MKLLRIISILAILSFPVISQSNEWTYFPVQAQFKCQALEGEYLWIGSEKYLSRLNTITGEREIIQPGKEISSIAVDHQGNKWIGTWGDGLGKFNGETWIYYNSSNTGLNINNITSVAVDHQDNIWIGTYGGLLKFDGQNWNLYNEFNSGLPNCCGSIVQTILTDQHGNIWVGTVNNGPYKGRLAKFDGLNWSIFDSSNSGVPFEGVKSIAIDSQGTQWLGTKAGLVKYDGQSWTTYNTSNSSLPQNDVNSVAVDFNGNKWVGTGTAREHGGGLAKFDGQTWTIYTSFGSTSIDWAVLSILIDEQGNKWIGTDDWNTDGYKLVEFNDQTWTKFNTSTANLFGYNFYSSSVLLDPGGNLWIGETPGVVKYDGQNWIMYDLYEAGLPYSVTSIAFDNMGNTWVGAWEGGLLKFDGENWMVFNESNSGLPSNNISCLVTDKEGSVWFIDEIGNIIKYDRHNWLPYTFNSPDSIIEYHFKIFIDELGIMWIPSAIYDTLYPYEHYCLSKFDGENWVVYNSSNSGFPEVFITTFAYDTKGNKWFGTPDNGLVKFDGENWTVYNTSNSDIQTNHVDALAVDSQNNVWIGSTLWGDWGGGLVKYDGQNWTFYSSSNCDLPFNAVNSIIIDKNENLWLGIYTFGLVLHKGGIIYTELRNYGTEKPADFSLEQNYPNPFNPATTIKFMIPKISFVNLKIYNILGKEIKTLINEEKPAGTYEVEFNGIGLSSGIYFYKLQAGEYSAVKKMILLK